MLPVKVALSLVERITEIRNVLMPGTPITKLISKTNEATDDMHSSDRE